MEINFSKLSSSANHTSLEPRDIFMALPSKDERYSYPRDVQTEVWKQWFTKRDEKNVIIKMNTGSGKTVVGLTILQSCLNEGIGTAVYVVPGNYLVTQVCAEARRLGIRVASDVINNGNRVEKGEDDYHFRNKSAILVTNIHKLVNGKSVFGLRLNGNVQIGSIIIDDIHACLDTIEQQYTVKIQASHSLYRQIITIFEEYPELVNSEHFYDITKKDPDPRVNKLIPFWIWQKSCERIRRLLTQSEYADDNDLIFNIPLLADNWATCNCVISANSVEITPKSIPISKITSFENAKRRIFMSATLADDSIFVSAMFYMLPNNDTQGWHI